jgi:hypothetical protein
MTPVESQPLYLPDDLVFIRQDPSKGRQIVLSVSWHQVRDLSGRLTEEWFEYSLEHQLERILEADLCRDLGECDRMAGDNLLLFPVARA